MLPFAQHIPNHPTTTPPATSLSQQVVGTTNNNFPPNLMQISSQMGFHNPQSSMPFNNPNTYMGNNSCPLNFMNFPQFNPLQNTHLGVSNMGSVQQAQSIPGFSPQNILPNGQLGNLLNVAQQFNHASGFQNGQFGWQNQMQSMNQLGSLAMLNPNQVVALAQLMGCANQVAQAMVPQNMGFVGNPQQFGLVQPTGVAPQNLGQQMLPQQQQQMPSVSSNPQHNQSPRLQGNLGKRHRMHNSNSDQHQHNFSKNLQRDSLDKRFQKSWDKHMHNTKGKNKFSDENGHKGFKSSVLDNSVNHSNSGKRRSLSMFYTEKEIQQWREERKKNYPSNVNLEKKLTNKEKNHHAAAEEAKIRRQQLKDILDKQVELGFEVPEIPSHYLLEPKDQGHGHDRNQKPFNNGRFQNRFNKRGKFDPNNRFDRRREAHDSLKRQDKFVKRKRVEGNDSSNTLLSNRKPTLLQKLLSADIRRDKRHLLQVFRFMVMNSFFKDGLDKPLDFPNVIVKETDTDSGVIKLKPSSLEEEPVGRVDDCVTLEDSVVEKEGCQEEGEITD